MISTDTIRPTFPMGPLPASGEARRDLLRTYCDPTALRYLGDNQAFMEACPPYAYFGTPDWDRKTTVRGFWPDWARIDSDRCAGLLASGPILPEVVPEDGGLWLCVDAESLCAALYRATGGTWAEVWSTY